jgi:hypothetical protein
MAGVTPRDIGGLLVMRGSAALAPPREVGPPAEGPIEIITACVALAVFVEAMVLNHLADRLDILRRSLVRGG